MLSAFKFPAVLAKQREKQYAQQQPKSDDLKDSDGDIELIEKSDQSLDFKPKD